MGRYPSFGQVISDAWTPCDRYTVRSSRYLMIEDQADCPKSPASSIIFTMLTSTLAILLAITTVLGCADHNYHSVTKRAGESGGIAWDYDIVQDWGRIDPSFASCQHGVTQAPIGLHVNQGLATTHAPNFEKYDISAAGTMSNWGFGPAMTFAHTEGDVSTLPSFSFEENGIVETVHLTGWHIHAPSDHVVDGVRTKAEMHLVHVNAQGTARAVISIRIAPGVTASTWFGSMPAPISYREIEKTVEGSMNPMQAIREVSSFAEYWTYQGESISR